MRTCPACGHENSDRAKFCEECAAPLAGLSVAREQRKTVSVLFCDITGSTALGESIDPEALRALLARYFERMKGIVESHGGTVEKFIGDAVMAVFGVPVVHEDDALRAVRAAVEMREALPELGVQARIGVNTGEVVTGTRERLATGDAVNVAQRLETAAAAGEVLLGEPTCLLVRDAVDVEPVKSLALKGKAKPVSAYRLLAVHAPAERPPRAPMVGRQTELLRLNDTLAQAVRDRSCQLFTILGVAGVGKSRLVQEFVRGADARVVRGSCLSYGEGITYWPVVEVVKQLDALPRDELAAAAVRSLLGETNESASTETIAWAFRKLLEEQAEQQPIVCVFDDLQWGEEKFLELVEHVADLARDAPILLLCMARPELLESRPAWGGGKLNATTVLLEPLDAAETEQLVDALGGAEREVRSRIAAAAEGNPLFVEEMLALVRESRRGDVSVPPTIQALLAARLDQLDPAERAVLERGAIEGRVFHRSAVEALSDGDGEVSARLVSLVRKEVVRPDRAQRRGDDAYRFRHLLIRDAAYDALPKATRAELHERFAEWLDEGRPDLVERDELLGHHLAQAARYKAELGQPEPLLAERAGERLAAAGRRALWRGDNRAGATLFERSLELLRPLRLDVHLELDLASTQVSWRRTASLSEATADRARGAGDHVGELLARFVAADARTRFEPEPRFDELEALAQEALPVLERAQDHLGLARVWRALGHIADVRGRYEEWARASERAIKYARLGGHQFTGLFGFPLALVLGPRPADEALRSLDGATPPNPHPNVQASRAWLLAMLGRFEEAWAMARDAAALTCEITREPWEDRVLAEIAMLAGDHESAAESFRVHCELLEQHDALAMLSTYTPALGRALCALGRYDEAERLAQRGRELGDERDAATQMLWRQVQARVHAARGEHPQAEALAREAVAIAEQTDALNRQGDALCDLAEVLAAARRAEEAAAALEQALERYQRKKNLAMAAQVHRQLETIRKAAPA
jgi:class 3 adenylate cyclase/tetratricopeptide (TPR) repeat protein